jgi:hypothetical protein
MFFVAQKILASRRWKKDEWGHKMIVEIHFVKDVFARVNSEKIYYFSDWAAGTCKKPSRAAHFKIPFQLKRRFRSEAVAIRCNLQQRRSLQKGLRNSSWSRTKSAHLFTRLAQSCVKLHCCKLHKLQKRRQNSSWNRTKSAHLFTRLTQCCCKFECRISLCSSFSTTLINFGMA